MSSLRLLLAGLALAGTASAQPPSARLEPGVLVDLERGAVYVAGADGQVEALDLATGRPRWSAASAARPLALVGPRLVAQAESRPGRLRLALLDVAAAGRLLGEFEVDLPEGVSAPIDFPAGVTFRWTVEPAGDAVELHWAYERVPLRGLAPGGDDEEDADDGVRRVAGRLRVEPAAGRLEALPAGPAEGLRSLPSGLAAQAEAGAFQQRPMWTGSSWVATQLAPGGRRVLRRFRADGTALPELPLAGDVTLQLVSADGRHLLLSRETGDPQPDRAHAWTVLALETGELAARQTASLAAAPFVVAAGRLLYVAPPWGRRAGAEWLEEPLQLRGVDAGGGQPLWRRTLRDSQYRGPWVP